MQSARALLRCHLCTVWVHYIIFYIISIQDCRGKVTKYNTRI